MFLKCRILGKNLGYSAYISIACDSGIIGRYDGLGASEPANGRLRLRDHGALQKSRIAFDDFVDTLAELTELGWG